MHSLIESIHEGFQRGDLHIACNSKTYALFYEDGQPLRAVNADTGEVATEYDACGPTSLKSIPVLANIENEPGEWLQEEVSFTDRRDIMQYESGIGFFAIADDLSWPSREDFDDPADYKFEHELERMGVSA